MCLSLVGVAFQITIPPYVMYHLCFQGFLLNWSFQKSACNKPMCFSHELFFMLNDYLESKVDVFNFFLSVLQSDHLY